MKNNMCQWRLFKSIFNKPSSGTLSNNQIPVLTEQVYKYQDPKYILTTDDFTKRPVPILKQVQRRIKPTLTLPTRNITVNFSNYWIDYYSTEIS